MENKEQNNEIVQNNKPNEQQADFSKIFNVESEETPEPTPVVQPEEEIKKTPTMKAVFNGEEEVLHTIEEEKDGNSLVPILLFVVLIAIVFLLPYISTKVELNVFDPHKVTPPTNPEEENDEFYYFNKSSERAKIGTLEFTNFVKANIDNEYTLSFTLNNVGEKSFDFSKKYYIVMYNEDKVVYRALIHSYDGLGALSATTLTLKINRQAFDDANRFKLEEIPTASYSSAKTVTVDGDYDVLTCTYNYDTIKYYFIDKELIKLSEEYLEPSANNSKFAEHRQLYKNYSNKYKQVNSLSSTFVETDDYFQMINEIELKNVQDVTMTQLRTYRFFKYKEKLDVISFELEAQGYTCG